MSQQPLVAEDFPITTAHADSYQIVPCAVDPLQVRLIVFSHGHIAFTRRLSNIDEARVYARNYAHDDAFHRAARASALNEATIKEMQS